MPPVQELGIPRTQPVAAVDSLVDSTWRNILRILSLDGRQLFPKVIDAQNLFASLWTATNGLRDQGLTELGEHMGIAIISILPWAATFAVSMEEPINILHGPVYTWSMLRWNHDQSCFSVCLVFVTHKRACVSF